MPHQCTGCGHTFDDGSKEMLSGCPECGGNKFQFSPTLDAEDDGSAEPTDPDRPEEPADGSSVAETVGRATTRVRDFVSNSPQPDPDAAWPDDPGPDEIPDSTVGDDVDGSDIIDADAREAAATEDTAQASARSDVVSESDIPSASDPEIETPDDGSDDSSVDEPTADGRIVSEPSGEEPDLSELRDQLNDQFESIKILEPGQYELNLMELYDREEYIIALQENGRYVIQVPDQWIGDDRESRSR